MKTYVTYLVLLTLGLCLGYVVFGDGSFSKEKTAQKPSETQADQVWTCSMHPQIKQAEFGQCPICGMDLTLMAIDYNSGSKSPLRMSKEALALANIQTTIVGNDGGTTAVIALSGQIHENEKAKATQTAHFGGRIEQLYINATGELVRKGQLVALIYSPELVAAQQELLTAVGLKASQPQLYNAVRNKLKIWKLSEAKIDAIATSGEVITNFPVYANVSGVVSEKKIALGDHVMEGEAMFQITNLSTVWAVFEVYEHQIRQVSQGQQLKVSASAYPDLEVMGEISFVDPILNTNTRTSAVRVVMDNQKGIWKPGMFVQGTLQGNSKVNASVSAKDSHILVPKSAVLWTGKRSLVYIKQQADVPIFEPLEVVLKEAVGDDYYSVDGLPVGAEIVTHGAFTIDAAAQLQGKRSMMNSKTAPTE